ncbi:hypothetical protein PLESHI_08904 [Plesiomonas shigelloides 302-73]|uniref:Reverse transcriptase Ty1/copia-type domain-containing protein n=1 Tax=Plesiomonas shigelloides 302-73 TaxID=1315976 RepID=R8AR14_PLESH|nr:hypothetical protein PLESHI_08904 [Plesiomonas shigelloides 302-73]
MDNCIVFVKFRVEKFIILVLYIDDILLVSNDKIVLHEKMNFFFSNFYMKDIGDNSNVPCIEVYRDISKNY